MNTDKKMKSAAAISLAALVVTSALYSILKHDALLSLVITLGTIAYHLNMRLAVGAAFSARMRGKVDYSRRPFAVGKREMALYEKLHVKKWKGKLPTYDSALYDPKRHTWHEIAVNMCRSELVHEVIAVLSFLPIFAGHWFGAYPVFVITSVLSAAFDMIFVVVQRYNRARVVRAMRRASR